MLKQIITFTRCLTSTIAVQKDDTSPFLRKVDKLVNSKLVRKTSEAADILGKEVKKLAQEFEDQLNEDYVESRDKGNIQI